MNFVLVSWKINLEIFILTVQGWIRISEGLRVGLQLNGEILNQSIEVDFNEIGDDLIEMRHIHDDKELIIEIL